MWKKVAFFENGLFKSDKLEDLRRDLVVESVVESVVQNKSSA